MARGGTTEGAVSVDVEGHLYTYMKQAGITLITVSHRETVWKYHDYLLRFFGDRQFEFVEMPEDKKINTNFNDYRLDSRSQSDVEKP